MPATKKNVPRNDRTATSHEYRGTRTRTGNSSGFRFDSAFFKSHPEFSGEVKAHVIAPGRMLVSVAEPVVERRDPVMESFLAFLANDIAAAPQAVTPLSLDLARRMDRLTARIKVRADEPLGEESLI